MNLALHSSVIAALITFFPNVTQDVEVPVSLAWQLPLGARYSVQSTIDQETTTTTVDKSQVETLTQATTRIVTVDKLNENGNMSLIVSTDAFSMRKSSGAMTITISAKRDENGKAVVDAKVETPTPAFPTTEYEWFFRDIGKNMLNIELHFELTPQGRVVKSRLDGNPFENIPATSDATRLASQMLAMMISTDDLLSSAGAELFLQLPKESIRERGHWDVAREMSVGGILMRGKGQGTLEEVERARDLSIAVIKESVEYVIATEGFETKLADLLTVLYKQFGMDLEVTIDLHADNLRATSHSRFDVEAGYCRTRNWEQMKLPLSGTMSVNSSPIEMQMNVVMKNGSSTWTPLKEER